ncbi:MAG: preprotein translocase subunit SecG [Alphaproteobacteria bacterium]|nr:MAG: preprotein translocase subunit SecG [Alphaproteobacteria bacterium]
MESVILVIHLILALLIIALVLLQRSEGGGLGIGGGSGGLGGLASAKGTANALTKMTGLCAAGFFITSLTLGVLASQQSRINQGILENVSAAEIQALDVTAPTGITYTPPMDIPSLDVETKNIEIQDVTETKDVNVMPPKTANTPEPSAPVE